MATFSSDSFAEEEPRSRALRVALQAEQAAKTFYESLAGQTQHDPLRQLYLELANIEDGHVDYIQRKLAALPAEGKRTVGT